MHPVTLLQNTPAQEIKQFCEANNYALNITGTGELILVHEAPEVKPIRTVKYVTMNVGALKEIISIARIGGTVELAKATDGTDIILGKTPQGYTRILSVEVTNVEEGNK